jgi:hypothetical protein
VINLLAGWFEAAFFDVAGSVIDFTPLLFPIAYDNNIPGV